MIKNALILSNSFTWKAQVISVAGCGSVRFASGASVTAARNRTAANLSALFSFIQLYANTVLLSLSPNYVVELNRLTFSLSSYWTANPTEFISLVKAHSNWFRNFLASGSRDIGQVPSAAWDPVFNCPTLLNGILSTLPVCSEIRTVEERLMIMLVLSALESHRVVDELPSVSYSSITAKWPAGLPDWNFKTGIILNRLGFNYEEFNASLTRRAATHTNHFASSNGPNGQALWGAHLDARAIMNDQEMATNIARFAKVFGMEHIFNTMTSTLKCPEFFLGRERLEHSRLVVIPTLGGKNRVVAQVDYWTQDIMTPLHDTLAEFLRSIPMDFTFNQDAGAERVRLLTSNNSNGIYSYDLSNATDRLPSLLQQDILRIIMDQDRAIAWRDLMVGRDFVIEGGNKVRYAVGQPMGIRTSFPMLALTHHIIVQQAALLAGRETYSDYAILGDDIVLTDKVVAEQYVRLMNDLGLTISLPKSIICDPESSGAGAEFAKRFYVNGVELTGLPVKAVVRTYHDGNIASTLQDSMERRAQITSTDTFWVLMRSLLKTTEFEELVRLNGLPEEVTGLSVARPNSDYPGYRWDVFGVDQGLSRDDFIHYYGYALVTDQINMLDRLATSNRDIFTTLFNAMDITKSAFTMSGRGVPATREEIQEWLINNIPKDMTHPLLLAVRTELAQYVTMILGIAGFSSSLTELLRSGRLRGMRSSILDTLPGSRARSGTMETRSLIMRMLKLLSHKNKEGQLLKNEHMVAVIKLIGQKVHVRVGWGKNLTVSPLDETISTTPIQANPSEIASRSEKTLW